MSMIALSHRNCSPQQQRFFGNSSQGMVHHQQQTNNYINSRMGGYNYTSGSIPTTHNNSLNNQHHHGMQHPSQMTQYPHVHQSQQSFHGPHINPGGNLTHSSSCENIGCTPKLTNIQNNNNNNQTLSGLHNNNNNGCKLKNEYPGSLVNNNNNNNVISATGNSHNGNDSVLVNSTNSGVVLGSSGSFSVGSSEFKYHSGNGNNNNIVESNTTSENQNSFHHAGQQHHHVSNQVIASSGCYRQNFHESKGFSLEDGTGGSTSSSSFPDGDVKPDLNGIQLPHSTFKSEVSALKHNRSVWKWPTPMLLEKLFQLGPQVKSFTRK